MENIGITKHQIDFIKNLRGRGFYSFNPRSDIENCNRLFEGDRNAQSAKIDRIQEDLASPISAVPVSTLVGNQAQPVPDFNVGNAFASPFGDDPPF
jgi:hypothetical protein